MDDLTGNGLPIPVSYYENFLESLAQLVSKLLTDQETEKVISSIRTFQEKLKRLSRYIYKKKMTYFYTQFFCRYLLFTHNVISCL